jgi:hypothetical protein
MLGAIGRERTSLTRAIGELAPFVRRANSTFVNLRATLDDLDPLVEESIPVTPKLRAVLAELRPFARDATPTFRNLTRLVKTPGEANDLTDLAHSTLPFRDVTVRRGTYNGARREGSFAASARSLRAQTPQWAFQRPYTVDFTGWFDDFSHSGVYDANGSASRVSTTVSAFAFLQGTLVPVPEELRGKVLSEVASLGQNNRARAPPSGPRPTARTPIGRRTLEHLQDRGFAIEKDSRSPGGRGFTGFEAILQYVFRQSQAINTFDDNSYLLKVSAFLDNLCAQYTDAQQAKSRERDRCKAVLGPGRPGIDEPDPSAAAGQTGPRASAASPSVRVAAPVEPSPALDYPLAP